MRNLRLEQEILKDWKGDVSSPLVSISCLAYNHEKYIEDALEGFLIQKTDFPFEILIHDDASTDGTVDIIREYEEKYPNLIKPVYQTENHFSKKGNTIGRIQRGRARGKYMALCEGDDYWTDPDKLQKQVDFLEANPDFVMCYHNAKIIDENGAIVKKSKLSDDLKKDFSREELIQGKMILTLTICYRNLLRELPDEYYKVLNRDKFFTSLLGNIGKGKYMHDITDAVYRKHSDAIWSKLDETTQIYHNGVTRAWLYRYYKRIGEDKYAVFFLKDLIYHFTNVLKKIASHGNNQHDDIIHDIFTNYIDIIHGESESQLRELLKFAKRQFFTGSDENKTTIQKTSTNVVDLQKTSDIIRSTPAKKSSDTLTINWVLTRKCNYTCTYCTVKDNKSGFFHDIAELTSAIDKVSCIEKEHIQFIITGGEPTICPGYIEFLKYIFHKLGTRATVATITNLSMPITFFKGFIASLHQYLEKISFIASFHFEHAEIAPFIEKVNFISGNGIFIKTQILAHPEYMDVARRLFDELNQISNEKLKIDVKIVRENFGPTPDKRYSKTDLDWLKKFYKDSENEEVDVALLTNNHKIENLTSSANELIANGLNRFKGFECYAGIESISINANGDIDPAVCFRGSGNMKSNIFTGDNPIINFQKPILCPFIKCACLADLLLTKKHPEYESLLKSSASSGGTSLEHWLNQKGWQGKKQLYSDCLESVTFQKDVKKPFISIIVISWRLHTDTIKNFQILQNQRNQNFELIFVDNGGKPGEFEPLKPYIDTYVRLNTNTGAYLARNIGAVFAKAPILLFLEDDGIPEQNIVEAHLSAHKMFDVIAVRGVYRPKTDTQINKLAQHYYMGDVPYPYPGNLEGNSSYRADCFYKVGGWDDDILFGYGGWDLAVRLLATEPDQRKQIYSPAPVIHHDFATSPEHLSSKRIKQESSLQRLKKKHPQWDAIINSWSKFAGRYDALIFKYYPIKKLNNIRLNNNWLLLDVLKAYERGDLDEADKLLLNYTQQHKESNR